MSFIFVKLIMSGMDAETEIYDLRFKIPIFKQVYEKRFRSIRNLIQRQ